VITPSSVRTARKWTARQLARTGPPANAALVDDAVLLVSELVTNAIAAASVHAAGPARVCLVIDRFGETVRIEVYDSSSDPVPPPVASDTEEESGRGLTVVAGLAAKWGWHPASFGKVVWCELAS
jgi:anti-sigma regulatory factor (Ser/Thr protein kinase)